jgi:hypothetical protein
MHNVARDKGHARINAQIYGMGSAARTWPWSYGAPIYGPGVGAALRSNRAVSNVVANVARVRARASSRANAALARRGIQPRLAAPIGPYFRPGACGDDEGKSCIGLGGRAGRWKTVPGWKGSPACACLTAVT